MASLLTFNLGVEGGQLVIVSLVYPQLWLLGRYRLERRAMQVVSAAILVVALYWFGERAFFT